LVSPWKNQATKKIRVGKGASSEKISLLSTFEIFFGRRRVANRAKKGPDIKRRQVCEGERAQKIAILGPTLTEGERASAGGDERGWSNSQKRGGGRREEQSQKRERGTLRGK